jgi:pseudouridine kinase
MKKNIYCLGGATLDYKLKPVYSLEIGTSNPVTSVTCFGGVARNIAENLAKLTQNIYLQCIVGNDGQALLSHLKLQRVNIDSSIVLDRYSSARYYAVLDQQSELYIAFADMEIYNHIPFDQFVIMWENWQPNSIILLDTNLSPQLIEYAIHQAQLKQCMLCIDLVSVTKSKKLPLSLNGIFLLKADKHEASALSGITVHTPADAINAGKILLSRGVQQIIITLGHLGYAIVNHHTQQFYEAIPIKNIVDVSGAGDAFFSGVLAGLQYDLSVEQAAKLGAIAASHVIQSYDTVLSDITFLDLITLSTQHNFNMRAYNATVF